MKNSRKCKLKGQKAGQWLPGEREGGGRGRKVYKGTQELWRSYGYFHHLDGGDGFTGIAVS